MASNLGNTANSLDSTASSNSLNMDSSRRLHSMASPVSRSTVSSRVNHSMVNNQVNRSTDSSRDNRSTVSNPVNLNMDNNPVKGNTVNNPVKGNTALLQVRLLGQVNPAVNRLMANNRAKQVYTVSNPDNRSTVNSLDNMASPVRRMVKPLVNLDRLTAKLLASRDRRTASNPRVNRELTVRHQVEVV
jgi:osmotically-inducible protein OsmY